MMTLDQILATQRKILYVNNTGVDVSMFDEMFRVAIYANSTVLHDDVADLFTLEYVQLGNESRAILRMA
jgi:hypothetical protein